MSELEFPIVDDETHAAALARVEHLIGLEPECGSVLADELVWLAERVEAYEKVRWPF